MPSDPTRPGGPRYTRAQRRLLTAVAGLIVAALAGGAYALTYDVLRELALAGRVGRRWAPLYPAMADTLTTMTILSLVITRNARWWTRTLRWALLLLLVAGGAALSVQHSVWGFASLPEDAVRAGVAVAPHVMLVVAVWLWLTMFKQIRVARPSAEEVPPADTQRGHVKVLEPGAPEQLALAAPPESEAASEPLIPFSEPAPWEITSPDEPRAPEPRTGPAAAHEEAPSHAYTWPTDEPTPQKPDQQEFDREEPSTASEPPSPPSPPSERPATERPAPQEPAYEQFAAGQSLSSEPAPPLDPLPEPRPPLDPLPESADAPPALLPTDVELIRARDRDDAEGERPVASTTRPDIVMPGPHGADEEDHDTPPADRAEDPDGGDHPDDRPAEGRDEDDETAQDVNPPPSSSFRSGPTPPAG